MVPAPGLMKQNLQTAGCMAGQSYNLAVSSEDEARASAPNYRSAHPYTSSN